MEGEWNGTMEPQTNKTSRIEARVSPVAKETISKAAALQGRSLSEFVVDALIEKAESVIAGHEVVKLNEAARKALFNALRNPPEPNAKLRQAAERHRTLIGKRR